MLCCSSQSYGRSPKLSAASRARGARGQLRIPVRRPWGTLGLWADRELVAAERTVRVAILPAKPRRGLRNRERKAQTKHRVGSEQSPHPGARAASARPGAAGPPAPGPAQRSSRRPVRGKRRDPRSRVPLQAPARPRPAPPRPGLPPSPPPGAVGRSAAAPSLTLAPPSPPPQRLRRSPLDTPARRRGRSAPRPGRMDADPPRPQPPPRPHSHPRRPPLPPLRPRRARSTQRGREGAQRGAH